MVARKSHWLEVGGSSPSPATKLSFYIMVQTIEQMVSSTILEKATDIELGGVVYHLADPSIATLILVSEIISTLPVVEKETSKKMMVWSALHYAKEYKAIGDICAILILGAKNLREEKEIIEEKRIFGLFPCKKKVKVIIDKQAELSRLILDNVEPSIIINLILKRLNDMEIGSFFSITTSLSEANILKPTKEVVQH